MLFTNTNNKNKLLIFRCLFLVYLGILAYLCFAKFDSMPLLEQHYYFGIGQDKIGHFLMFLPFPVLLYFATGYKGRNNTGSLVLCLIMFMVGAMAAAGSELGQALTPHRSCERSDFISDLVALSISSILVIIIDILRRFKENNIQANA